MAIQERGIGLACVPTFSKYFLIRIAHDGGRGPPPTLSASHDHFTHPPAKNIL